QLTQTQSPWLQIVIIGWCILSFSVAHFMFSNAKTGRLGAAVSLFPLQKRVDVGTILVGGENTTRRSLRGPVYVVE
ncbi:hypothetical protein BD769DRAFT_1472574, partial [Suillus cothurnatus]